MIRWKTVALLFVGLLLFGGGCRPSTARTTRTSDDHASHTEAPSKTAGQALREGEALGEIDRLFNSGFAAPADDLSTP